MSKFHNKKCYAFGLAFDSIKERDRYLYLRDRQKNREIDMLETQKKFVIVESQQIGRRRLREAVYIADFFYIENGKPVVEDVKGYKKGPAYNLFALKKKLMLQKYGIFVREV